MAPVVGSGRRPVPGAGGLPVLLSLLALLATGCASTRSTAPFISSPDADGSDSAAWNLPPAAFRAIYVIHGDADYTWHDARGRRLYADNEAMKQAVETAEASPTGEFFIFHQKPWKSRLFGNLPNGTFHHYRDGTLAHKQEYGRSTQPHDFEAETALFLAHAASQAGREDTARPAPLVFAYFGHEIPVRNQKGYSVSYVNHRFSIARFTAALARFVPPHEDSYAPDARKPFDLVVLSTCYGGNPVLLRALSPLADMAVASPAYLHLSYLDARALARLGRNTATMPSRQDVRDLADTIAAQSFERLKQRTQTEITVAVYDLRETRPFLEANAARALTEEEEQQEKQAAEKAEGRLSARAALWRDCGVNPRFDTASAARGVKLRYQPPRFGADKDKASRSAWECWE